MLYSFCRANIPKLTFDFTVLIPKLNFTGLYSLKIKLLLLNIQGKGDLTGSFSKFDGANSFWKSVVLTQIYIFREYTRHRSHSGTQGHAQRHRLRVVQYAGRQDEDRQGKIRSEKSIQRRSGARQYRQSVCQPEFRSVCGRIDAGHGEKFGQYVPGYCQGDHEGRDIRRNVPGHVNLAGNLSSALNCVVINPVLNVNVNTNANERVNPNWRRPIAGDSTTARVLYLLSLIILLNICVFFDKKQQQQQ